MFAEPIQQIFRRCTSLNKKLNCQPSLGNQTSTRLQQKKMVVFFLFAMAFIASLFFTFLCCAKIALRVGLFLMRIIFTLAMFVLIASYVVGVIQT
jgi:hypothetical protein